MGNPQIFFIFLTIECIYAYSDFDRPRVRVADGNLFFSTRPGKNITFEISEESGIYINNFDLKDTITKAHNASSLTKNYAATLEKYRSRLETLEQRIHEPTTGVANPVNETEQLFTKFSLVRLNRRITQVQRKLAQLTTLLYKDECDTNPCQNGGVCQDLFNDFMCICREGWEGPDCSQDVNECSKYLGTDLGCQNGATCLNKPGSYECICPGGFVGLHCTRRKADCLTAGTELCGHGICVQQNTPIGYKCICEQGWTNDGTNAACTVDVNECEQNHLPCSVNPRVVCVNVPGSFYCAPCPHGFTGNGYHCSDIDECTTNNGGCSTNPMVQCINTHGSRVCGLCPPGYSGDGTTCTYLGQCNINNGGCHHLAACKENSRIGAFYVECSCPSGFFGDGKGPNGCIPSENSNPCQSNPCKFGICSVNKTTNDYVCTCTQSYTGRNCDILTGDPCLVNPCLNDGTCKRWLGSFKCFCDPGFSGERCEIEEGGCGLRHLKEENGVLQYPKDFQTYNNPVSCLWDIGTPASSKKLKITIKTFDLESSVGCRNNSLMIYDDTNLLGIFCGNKLPLGGNIILNGSELHLRYYSASGRTGRGFLLTWNTTALGCGRRFTSFSHGSLQYPEGTGGHSGDRDCYWKFATDFGKRITFHITSLQIGNNDDCNHNYLEFYSFFSKTDSLYRKFCNSSTPAPFYSPGAYTMIRFHSKGDDSHTSFHISYSAVEGVPGCGGIFSGSTGIIEPPTVENSLLCEYRIDLPIDNKIKLTFSNFQQPCASNEVQIREGPDANSPLVGRYCSLTVPDSYLSNSNQLYISSRVSSLTKKWQIKYKKVCGKSFTEASGSFTIRPSNRCIYVIARPPGFVITAIIKMEISKSSLTGNKNSCGTASVLNIKDGDNEDAPIIEEFCGSSTEVTSTHNYLWIEVNSIIVSLGEISLEYTSLDVGCGGILKERHGSIASPSHTDGLYRSSSKCSWLILAPPQNVIQLSWLTFSVEQSYECTYDKIQVYDNNTVLGMGGLMGTFCGTTLPPTLLSSSNMMTVVFTTDVTINMDGFLASYLFIPDNKVCGGNYFTAAGVVKSPRYPETYPTNLDCIWTITVPSGQQIMLNITNFDIEDYQGCAYDILEIRNGGTSLSPLIGTYCGSAIPHLIPSQTNKLYLHFKSDMSGTGPGFKILWTSTATGCGGVLTSPSGSIISPHYPQPYDRNTECTWKIITSAGSLIQVVFVHIDLEKHAQCLADYVELFDGLKTNSKSLGKFCQRADDPIRSTGHEMLINFRSDVAFQETGFQLHYTTICRNTVSGFRGVIESPNFPNGYPENQDCLWIIVVPSGNRVNLTFSHFDLERTTNYANKSYMFDYIEIKYKDEVDKLYTDTRDIVSYGKYCSDTNPGHLTINSDYVEIHFITDQLVRGSGFRLEWELFGCGGHMGGKSSVITSPNYPLSYPTLTECQWLIEVDYGYSVQIEFNDVDIEQDSGCDFDYIKIYNGMNNNSNVLAILCRQKKKTIITSTGRSMFIEFKSDYSYHGKGFLANYTAVPSKCGGIFTATEGTILTPNYPKNYNRNDSCVWYIEVDDGNTIDLIFEEFDLISTINCSRSYVKVYDGPTGAYPILATLCGNEKPNDTIRSSYNHMYIEFRSLVLTTSKGFLAKYYKSCGSKITSDSNGVIELNANEFSNYITTCTWVIAAKDPSKHVSLTITHMDTAYYYESMEHFVKIYNGGSTKAPLLGSYGTTKTPPTLVSDGNQLTIYIDNVMHFFATYSVYDSHCGGTLTSAEGYFATPNYPKMYPSDGHCEWTLQVAPGNTVSLNFIAFNLLEDEKCDLNYLEIRSNNSSGKLLGVFCGIKKPDNITHVGSLWLFFKSSKFNEGEVLAGATGFYAQYILNTFNDLKGTWGEIYSPLYPLEVLSRSIYTWRITVGIRKRILLTFNEFYADTIDLEEEDCYFSRLEVFDGMDNTATRLGQYCGTIKPDPIKSSSNIMCITISYMSAKFGTLFRLEWLEIDSVPTPVLKVPLNSSCGSSDVIDMSALQRYSFTSPGYPKGYAPNLQCEWKFSTLPMNHLEIYFSKIDFSTHIDRYLAKTCQFNDVINLYQKTFEDNDWQKFKTLCQHNTTSFPTTNLLKVEFLTTRSFNGSGFSATVTNHCGGSVTDTTGYIIIDNTTATDTSCQWNITVRSTKTIELTFEKMNLNTDVNGACTSSLMIRNGKYPDSPLLGKGKFCGPDLPEKLNSTSNNLYIKYDGIGTTEFRLKYQEMSTSCGEEISLSPYDNFTQISSPNYPNIPDPHIECQWVIRAPPGESLRIDFEDRFDLTTTANCDVEYVEIRDGATEYSKLLGRYCSSTPNSVISTDHQMFVKFFTDTDDPKNGFKAKISVAACGGTLRGFEGDLSYASDVANKKQSNCTWYIVGPIDHYLTLTFVQINLIKSNRCDSNYISITEVVQTTDDDKPAIVQRAQLCGTEIPQPITTASNELVIRYVVNSNGHFSLKFVANQSECGGVLKQESGEISSPGYPGMTHMQRECRWQIEVPEGRRVTLNIIDMDMDPSRSKRDQGLSIFDEQLFSLIFLNYNEPGQPIESSSNRMVVFFWSSYPSNHRGFKANFTSNQPTLCRGEFSGNSGQISTPTERNYSYACKWNYKSNKLISNQTIALSISLISNTTRSMRDKSCEYSLNAVTIGHRGPKNILGRVCYTTIDPVIIRSPFLGTKIQAIANTRIQMNFTISYQVHPCGGLLLEPEGTVVSPNYPNEPSQSVECAWMIEVPSGQKINLTSVDFNLGDDCEKNYLAIYNGDLPTHPRIQRVCKNSSPIKIISQSNKLFIEYRWQQHSNGVGFRLKYEGVSTGCGGIFHDKVRIIETPNYGTGDYPNNAECVWEINASTGYYLKLQFLDRFHIEDSDDCVNDYLEIYDTKDDMSYRLTKICGRNAPTGIRSTENKLTLIFRSNDRIPASGFKIKWEWHCGGTFESKEQPQYIVSPGYPISYVGNLDCTYKINSKLHLINLQFIDFQLEDGSPDCKFDNVTITTSYRHGLGFQATFCEDKIPEPLTVRSNVEISFKTDKWLNRRGFKLMFKDDSCGGNITTEQDIEYIKNNKFDSLQGHYRFPRTQHCSWRISAPPNQIVILDLLQLHSISSPSCFGQRLEVYSSLSATNDKRLAQLCGKIEGRQTLHSDSGKMLVTFFAGLLFESRFRASVRFSHGPAEGCGGIVNLTDTQYIQSPNLGKLDCIWKVMAPKDYQIDIEVTEVHLPSTCSVESQNYTECDCAILEIRDGGGPFSDLIESICSYNQSKVTKFQSFGNAVFIRFMMRGQKENAFKMTLVPRISICGPSVLTVTKEVKTLISPSYPSNYPLVKCHYDLVAPGLNNRIWMHFVDLNLSTENQFNDHEHLMHCNGDTIGILEDQNSKMITEGLGPSSVYRAPVSTTYLVYNDNRGKHVFCGKSQHPFDYYSAKPVATLFFDVKDKAKDHGKGFKLEYAIAGCNRNYTELQGRVSNGFSGGNCTISIEVPKDMTISLYFNMFFMTISPNCTDAHLEVRDGSPNGNLLVSACGYRLPNPVFSYTNKLYIHTMNVKTNFMRYDFAYTTTNAGRGCGGELYNYVGRVFSPMYPNQYRDDSECSWIIKAPVGLHLVLKFMNFDIQGNCKDTHVNIETYDYNGKMITREFCPNDAPATVRSVGSIRIIYTSSVHNGGSGWAAMYNTVRSEVF